MSLKESLEKLKFDARMVDINMKTKVLSEEELKSHLAKLQDLESSALQLDLDNSSDDDSETY